jgi:hypothetical protein
MPLNGLRLYYDKKTEEEEGERVSSLMIMCVDVSTIYRMMIIWRRLSMF